MLRLRLTAGLRADGFAAVSGSPFPPAGVSGRPACPPRW